VDPAGDARQHVAEPTRRDRLQGPAARPGDGSLDRDRRRASDLLAAGWLIVNVTGRDVYTERGRFTDLLRRLLSQRGA
jgi:hypothetical protein